MSQQLSLFTLVPVSQIKTVQDPYWDEIVAPQHIQEKTDTQQAGTPYNCVGAQVALDTKKVAPQHDTHWVEKYWVERSGNKYWYYRYCWMTGRKKNRIYLGSANSAIAKNRKADVEAAINDGQTPQEIQHLIHSWRHHSQPNS
ncbi:hypothetical protein [Fortiea contorta]|uniref:hypothetical protein n=1 Tax=Fortiea contorta TaxID=1892405 RepID=UPI0003708835|nr:hypothetical protein [Fortiea contorta]